MGATATSQPNRIPERIVPHAPHQPRPDRIGDDVARDGEQILIPVQGMIVERPRPHCALRPSRLLVERALADLRRHTTPVNPSRRSNCSNQCA